MATQRPSSFNIRVSTKKVVGGPVSLRRLREDVERPQTSPKMGKSMSEAALLVATPGPETLEPLEEAPRPRTSSDALASTRSSLVTRMGRCYGCGGVPEMCTLCFSACKKDDMTKYKQSLAKGVEWLFAKATARAFNHVASTLIRMVFGVWKFYVQHRRHHRQYVLRFQTRVTLKKLFLGWRLVVYERRTYGAMLYAAEEHVRNLPFARVETLEIETNNLQGTVTELSQKHNVRAQLDDDKMHKLHALIAEEKQRVADKNKELAALKTQLAVAVQTIDDLTTKAKLADALAPIEAELFDYKKACFQMANEMFTQMEGQLEEYSLFEGQQNLSDILSGDVVNSLDHMEHPLLVDPTAKFGKEKKDDNGKPLMAGKPKKKPEASALGGHVAGIDRADRILMQWANAMLRKAPMDWIKAARINNCNTNLQDGKAYAVLTLTLHDAMCKMKSRKKDFSANPLQRENGMALNDQAFERYVALMAHEVDDTRRIEFMMNTLGQAMWLPTEFVTSDDILAGDTDFNLVFLGYLFCTASPLLDDAHMQHCSDVSRQLTFERAKWRELKDLADSAKDSSVSKKIKLALAHLLEMKKKLDADTRKAHDGHMLWWKSVRIVLRKCFLTLSMMAHGKSGFMCSADKSAENEGFLVVPREKLKNVVFATEDTKWEFDMLQGYLNSVFNDLARIYRGYASRSTQSDDVAFMSQGDLMDLLTECNIPDANFALTDMADILIEVTQNKTAAENGIVDLNRALMPVEYIEALIRIARKRYSGLYKKTALSESFCLLVDNQILPLAYQSDADKFRKQVESPGIRSLLVKYLDDMKQLFAKYSFDFGSNKKSRKQARMTAHSLLKFVSDKSIEDLGFTDERIMQVVGHVCQGRTLSKTELMAKEVTFEAFQEAMIAMACHKFPDPYLSVENRFEKFANLYVVAVKDSST
ncbi:Aste57867_21740 [Aphanomyces stellatus]|uniref:Aste57867_21740 protein n=1 Tax=Aphanomyces stellatus TaxID=120398 RepID=A0A485LKE4_9STRA|nr:hypothetical protein As57867_021671 [Aphanomyces stellatus]VFT98409.1 Aste57867_21740 [Aphanomyces stellatus]